MKKPKHSKPQKQSNQAQQAVAQKSLDIPSQEILDKLPESVRVSVIEAAAFSGPLPPPSMYNEYNEVLPGSAERILTMAEKEQDHRIKWESDALETQANDQSKGQNYGLIMGIVCIAGSVILVVLGEPIVAGLLAGAPLVGIVGKFIQGRNNGK